ncbi:uncharacterized protein LOC132044947 [Lycium ferocissimum]|uniref:uncharacterized protein LOC132044947 n=1 Tax=Lycium ferocissimum TaxID=112874 RepID=UPI0028167271|nr:uncharacterized protein LOC132044947 [Lycium ferocissimum]
MAERSGLGRRFSTLQPASVDEPATLGSNFDISGSAWLIAEAKKKKKKPKSRGQKRKKSSKDAAEKMTGLSWQCLLNQGMYAENRAIMLVNKGFIRAQHEIDDLRAQLDAQSQETEEFKLLLQQKEDQLSQIKNKVLEEDNKQLYQGNSEYVSKLSELEATITQLRQGLDSVKGQAANMEEKFRRLESKRAAEKENLKVAQEKVETRARANEKLKSELDAAIRDNDGLQAELATSNEGRITLSDMRSELEEKLKKAQFDLKEAYEEIEATEARSTLLVEYEK